jgi:hypothetical protein
MRRERKPKRPRNVAATSPEWRAYLKAIGYVMPCYCKGTPPGTCSTCGGHR